MYYYGNFRGFDILKPNLKKECVFFLKPLLIKRVKNFFHDVKPTVNCVVLEDVLGISYTYIV